MVEKQFNLIDEPWIPVTVNGARADLSIREVFERSNEISAVNGEMPTQEYAITRLLSTILHAANRDFDPNDAEDHWRGIWDSRHNLSPFVDSYLDQVHDRFWLIHPETPFYQLPGMPRRDDKNNLKKIVAEVPDNVAGFPMRSESSYETLSLAEAARWLIHLHGYDTAGIKTGYAGHPRLQAGKVYGQKGVSVAGWFGRSGQILIEGGTLAETIVLNFTPVNPANPGGRVRLGESNDRPIWEQPHPKLFIQASSDGITSRTPLGPLDVATWQTRRALLFVDGDRVVNASLTYGDNFTSLPVPDEYDPATAWKYDDKTERWRPVFHEADRAFWPGLITMLAVEDTTASRSPLALRWLRHLRRRRILKSSFTIRAIGVEYGSQQALINSDVDDRVPVGGPLIEGRKDLISAVEDAYASVRSAISDLGKFADNVAQAKGFRPGDRQPGVMHSTAMNLKAAATHELDREFRAWVSGIDDDTDSEDATAKWRETVRSTLRNLSYSHALAAGPRAAAGRQVDTAFVWSFDKKAGRFRLGYRSTGGIEMSSAIALDHFNKALDETFNQNGKR